MRAKAPISVILLALLCSGSAIAQDEQFRERQVLDLIVGGNPNKIIAENLEISLKTVEHHRSRIMSKMGAQSAVDLVRRVLEARGSGSAH